MLNINNQNPFEIKFKETIEKTKSLPNHPKIEKIAQSWIYDNRGSGLDAIIAQQRMQQCIDLGERIVEACRNI